MVWWNRLNNRSRNGGENRDLIGAIRCQGANMPAPRSVVSNKWHLIFREQSLGGIWSALTFMILVFGSVGPSGAETLPEALVKAYQSNPQLNADRARQRGTDENVPQALAGYRPQVGASLSAGLQAVRNLLPDNTVQGGTVRPWTIRATVTQIFVIRLQNDKTSSVQE